MPSQLRYQPNAVADVNAAAAWYDERNVALGNRFRKSVVESVKKIAESPELFGYLFPDLDVRAARLQKFPYLVLFRHQRELTHVLAVLHTATDPHNWRRRMENS
jgi:plasmid stabilization system protein ParE